ncbi:MAG: box helicase [Marmoricola sp.]|nr:box helicase [Marmoricola sp.]
MAAFEQARAGGSGRWWVTMPPGAGKTLVGTEVARVLGRRTVVLSPNTAIQGQWIRTWDSYDGQPAGSNRDLRTVFTALTYQSLAVFAGDEGDDRTDVEGGDEGEGSQIERLHANGRALIETLRAAGPLTLILDECHHLLEVWGELLREVLDELPEAVVLGLTATPPGSMTRSQAELTETLFGPILYEARIPALVKEGTLAPYAELAWLVEPTADEASWLAEQATRFAELTADLFDPEFGSTPLPEWLTQRLVRPCSDGSSSWEEITARDPELADAALRLVHAALLELPEGALLREQHRQPPTADDWRALLDDWLLGCVQPRSLAQGDEGVRDQRVIEAVRRTLPAIGYVWTRKGIRTGRGNVDRVTARSAAKQAAVTGIVTAELSNLAERTRVLVLCDHEQATATTSRRLSDDETTPPEPAGSATGVLAGLLADPTAATLHPLLVTGKTVAGDVETLNDLVAWIDRTHPGMAASLTVDATGEVPTLSGRWNSGQWVAHATAFFVAGGTRCLVGTRGLLGEGWDAPAITTLVDLTTATTPTAVTQTRGRGLRTDPADPEKVALIWSVVAVFEGHVAGANDWLRFARKHRGYFTVDEHGEVVDGVAGVDSGFSGFHPPPVSEFASVDARMLVRGEDRALVRHRWLDTPSYDDRVDHVARIRADRPAAGVTPAVTTGTAGLVPWTEASKQHPGGRLAAIPVAVALVLAGVLVTLGHSAAWALLLVPALVVSAALWGRTSVLAASRHRATVGLVAAAVADGLRAARLAPVGADALHVETTPDGVDSFSLSGVPDEVSSRFALALEEVVAPMSAPRYVLPRWVTPAPHGVDGLVRGLRAVVRHTPEAEVWHTVPSALADTRAHADAYATAWNHWVGGGPAVYASSPEGAGVLATHRGMDPFSVTCVIRRVWH